MTKSDTRLAEERVRRLEKDVEVFQAWVDKRGQLRERIIKKVRGSYWASSPNIHYSTKADDNEYIQIV